LIQDIKKLTEQNNITIYHTLQKGNQCVDFMIKLKILLNIDLLIDASPPYDILSLKNDAAKTFFSKD